MQQDHLEESVSSRSGEIFSEEKQGSRSFFSTKEDTLSRTKTLYYYAKFMIVIGIFGHSLYYLQAFKIYRQASAEDVSLEGFLIALFSLTCWLIYGVLMKDKVLIIVNIVGVIGAALTTLAIFSVYL
jgi:MtN3 and saliva related transmembrane protein